jgi:uncharacterized Ntn-hydrolase superfamily protein
MMDRLLRAAELVRVVNLRENEIPLLFSQTDSDSVIRRKAEVIMRFWIGALTLVVLGYAQHARATWSVIAVDQRTGEVVIASATCVSQERLLKFPSKGLMDIQAIVVPGKGVAAAQAGVDRSRANQQLIYRELQKGTDPQAIMRLLHDDPNIEVRQFGILDLQGRMAGYSGAKNGAESLHSNGQVPGEPIFYSIQGNILAGEDVVHSAVEAFKQARGLLTDRVMAAMEAADSKGGDRRCSCDSRPKVDAPCESKTAHVAYILKADRNDSIGSSFNDGRYTMYLSVTDKDIQPDENANPVTTLRMRYDRAMKKDR